MTAHSYYMARYKDAGKQARSLFARDALAHIGISCSYGYLVRKLFTKFQRLPNCLGSTTAEPSVGELRYIARLKHSVLPNGYTAATTAGTSGAIEGSDVYLVSGQSRSKFYSSRQYIDDQ